MLTPSFLLDRTPMLPYNKGAFEVGVGTPDGYLLRCEMEEVCLIVPDSKWATTT